MRWYEVRLKDGTLIETTHKEDIIKLIEQGFEIDGIQLATDEKERTKIMSNQEAYNKHMEEGEL